LSYAKLFPTNHLVSSSIQICANHQRGVPAHIKLRLAPGDSGSWVIRENKVCGHVSAGRSAAPWVYMVPMERVFEDISIHMSEAEVGLPKRSEVKGSWAVSTTVDGTTAAGSSLKPPPSRLTEKAGITRNIQQASDLALPITIPPGPQLQVILRRELWGGSVFGIRQHESNLEPYWDYYSGKCASYLQATVLTAHDVIKTHGDLLEITQMLKYGIHRDEIKNILCSKLGDSPGGHSDYGLDLSIDLAASVLLMMNFTSSSAQSLFTAPGTQLRWNQDSLKRFVWDFFDPGSSPLVNSGTLNRRFTAMNLQRINGVKISWTSNLAEHLSFDEARATLHLFHHATFLLCQFDR